jgi:hypothetical protein
MPKQKEYRTVYEAALCVKRSKRQTLSVTPPRLWFLIILVALGHETVGCLVYRR